MKKAFIYNVNGPIWPDCRQNQENSEFDVRRSGRNGPFKKATICPILSHFLRCIVPLFGTFICRQPEIVIFFHHIRSQYRSNLFRHIVKKFKLMFITSYKVYRFVCNIDHLGINLISMNYSTPFGTCIAKNQATRSRVGSKFNRGGWKNGKAEKVFEG